MTCELLNALVTALTMASAPVDEIPTQNVVQPTQVQVADAQTATARPRPPRRAPKAAATPQGSN